MAWRPFFCMETLDSNLILKETKKTLVFSADKSPPKHFFLTDYRSRQLVPKQSKKVVLSAC